MVDSISRAAAIDAICEDGTWLERQGCTEITMVERKERDVDILSALPSFSQPHENDHTAEASKMDDPINRRAAIDALSTPHGILYPIRTIENMPSAQPDSSFITWLLDEIWDEDMWALNWQTFPEILCRKLVKMGYVREKDGGYERLDI